MQGAQVQSLVRELDPTMPQLKDFRLNRKHVATVSENMKVKFRKHITKNIDETEKSEFVGRGSGDH